MGVSGFRFCRFSSWGWLFRWVSCIRKFRAAGYAPIGILDVMVVLAGCFVYGVWKLHGESEEPSAPLNVLLVQLNIPQEASQRLWSAEDIYRGYEEETLEALESLSLANEQRVQDDEGGALDPVSLDVPDWIVWPESALPDVLHGEKNEQELGRSSLSLIEEIKSRGEFSPCLECWNMRPKGSCPLLR